MIRKKKMLLILSVMLLLLIAVSCFVSYKRFGVVNSFSTGIALVKVIFTDTEYVEVQKYPKVIIAKSNNSESRLVEYMKSKGFDEDNSGRDGAILRFENEISVQYVLFSENNYYSTWSWRE